MKRNVRNTDPTESTSSQSARALNAHEAAPGLEAILQHIKETERQSLVRRLAEGRKAARAARNSEVTP